MPDLTTIVDTHLAAYGEPDSQRRAELIELAWTADSRLLDPPLTVHGHDGISAAADSLQAHYAEHRFRRVSAIDAHHDQLRYAWELVAPDGGVVLSGLDVGAIAADGRLAQITGFFGELGDTDAAA